VTERSVLWARVLPTYLTHTTVCRLTAHAVVRVPLMIHVPWLPDSWGRRATQLVELVDVFPTVRGDRQHTPNTNTNTNTQAQTRTRTRSVDLGAVLGAEGSPRLSLPVCLVHHGMRVTLLQVAIIAGLPLPTDVDGVDISSLLLPPSPQGTPPSRATEPPPPARCRALSHLPTTASHADAMP